MRFEPILRVWNAIGRGKYLMSVALFVSFLNMVMDSIGLSWTLACVSNAALNLDMQAVQRASSMLVGVALAQAVLSATSGLLECRVAEGMALELRRSMFGAVLGGRVEYFDAHESGDLVSRLNNDVEAAKQGVRTLASGFRHFCQIGVASLGLLIWSWQFSVGLLAIAGVAFLAGASTARPLKAASRLYQETLAKMSDKATNLLGGVAVIKTLGAEREVGELFDSTVAEHRRAGKKRGLHMAVQRGVTAGVPYLSLAGLIILAGSLSLRGLFPPGDAIGMAQLATRVLFPFTALGGVWATFQQSLAALERVKEACAIPQERVHGGEDGGARDRDAGLEFRDVHFGYGTRSVLKGLSFSAKAGDRVALTGPSGSGKTTALRLLLGMYEPGRGAIVLGGRDSRDMSLREMRECIALVPQEPWLASGTVLDNILLGRPDATDEEVEDAVRAANAQFVHEIPGGLNAEIKSNNLSGGERQRICLARAFLKNAPILLLDEPTSAVDAESERLIRQSVDALGSDQTVMTVAHTEAMVDRADVRVVLGGSANT